VFQPCVYIVQWVYNVFVSKRGYRVKLLFNESFLFQERVPTILCLLFDIVGNFLSFYSYESNISRNKPACPPYVRKITVTISVCAGLPHCFSHMVIIIFYISYIQIERTADFVYTYVLCIWILQEIFQI
jgi:hypothetical protein